MKLIQFAVASIVDANSSYIFNHEVKPIAYVAEERHAREIRAKTFAAVAAKLTDGIRKLASSYRSNAEKNRALKELRHLNSHLLRDIGLTVGDLNAVEDGIESLKSLNNRRIAGRENTRVKETAQTGPVVQELTPANQHDFEQSRCA